MNEDDGIQEKSFKKLLRCVLLPHGKGGPNHVVESGLVHTYQHHSGM